MLSKIQFDVLYTVCCNHNNTPLRQRDLAQQQNVSLGKINACCKDLKRDGLLDEQMRITPDGIRVLEPYRVKNAIIMAAGMSSRFAPLSYEKPKSLLVVKGEVLIERQIRQLKETGILDITVVVGYMKEKMFYLADKMGVNVIVNEDYYRYNNTSTLIRVADKLSNTYICSSDNYFTENVFEPYVYQPYYAAVFEPGETDEYCLKCNSKGRIQQVNIGGRASWYMIGHVYFSREFSRKFVEILKTEYSSPVTKAQLWEDLYIRHISELDLYIRTYDENQILEFDSLEDLRKFDSNYVANVDSNIFRNIKKVFQCDDSEILVIQPLKTGMTNTSFVFSCRGEKYVYRHPGIGTNAYINRASEFCAMKTAKELGLDNTYICMDPAEGWKISHYIENAKTLDYHDAAQVDEALSMMRRLHNANIDTKYDFDLLGMIRKFSKEIEQQGRDNFVDYAALSRDTKELFEFTEQDNVPKCLCHCDCYDPNFLIDQKGKMYLIDWEYSGKADPACDLGTFIACSDYSSDEAQDIIRRYLQRDPLPGELRHYLAYVSILSYYWFLWALYQESIGKTVGEYLYTWYKYTKLYGAQARMLYKGENAV